VSAPVRLLFTLHTLRLGLAIAGFVTAVVGVVLENRQVAWGAIALLIGSLICRILIRKRENRDTLAGEDCDGNHR
jgi:hypothetical protein